MPWITKIPGQNSAENLSPKETDDVIFTIDELIKRRALELQDLPLLGYPREGLADHEEHSAEAVDKYVDAAVQCLQQRGLEPADSESDQAPVVGILAHSSLQFIITLLGLSRLGYAVLLLSTRLASPAILSLLKQADCTAILTTPQFHHVLGEVHAENPITLLEMLKHEDYYGVESSAFHRHYDPVKESPKRAVIIHSSGSTGLPKPIFLTHRSCIAAFATNLDRKALMTQPLFHSFGFYETFRSIYSGKPMYYVNYEYPLTKRNLLATLRRVQPELFFCVPYVLKLLADSEDGIEALAAIDLIMYGGSACPDDLGDRLVRRGVNICANYGATETGRVMTSVRPPGDTAWNYLRILPQVKQFLLMDEIAPGIYECVALDGLKSKSTINSNDPPNSFRTRDLFTRHPKNPHFWKYVSRLDDRLTLVNGEKVLPIPIEGRIRQEALVQEAVVFGDGKTVPGLIIVRADAAANLSDEEFLQHIWPSVEDANSRAESFARIPREMVVVLPAGTTYACTDKSTFIRAQVYEQFKREIEDAYMRFENDAGGSLALSLPELEEYLLRQFGEQLGVTLTSAETDFFACGIDSLQCLKMWSLIKKDLDLGGKQGEVGQNILYETGNVAALARYLHALRTGAEQDIQDPKETIANLIAKYSNVHPSRPQAPVPPKNHVILLTGATGSLGAHLLSQLLSHPSTSHIYVLVRASSPSTALSRTLSSLSSRNLTPSPSSLSKLTALPSALHLPTLGIPENHLDTLRSSLTHVIHSAWAVNFNLRVEAFEREHIAGIAHLLDVCAGAAHRARFFFCSSVSVAGGMPRPGEIKECGIEDVAFVQGTGYARSKFIGEEVVVGAARRGVSARVLRVGQLVGDSKGGVWNVGEGVPLMMRTAERLGVLPQLDEEMSWLPVDYAAEIILDLAFEKDGRGGAGDKMEVPDLVFHVVNPRRFHWTRDMLPALSAAGLRFEAVPTEQWMEKLRHSDRDPERNPPIKLLDWFESKYGHGGSTKAKGPLAYLTEETSKRSETMGRIPDVTDVEYVKLMVDWLEREWKS